MPSLRQFVAVLFSTTIIICGAPAEEASPPALDVMAC